MSTEAQINANRQNAQKSTGPKTAEGKAAVSQNAVKHGLFAAEAVISVENPAEYELYRQHLLAELLPVGVLESMLAERIVSLGWRLQRAERIQNEVFDNMIETYVTDESALESRRIYCSYEGIQPGDPRYDPEHLALGRIAWDDWANSRVLDRLLLYERRIESSLHKSIIRLKQYQVIRRVEKEDPNQKRPGSKSKRPARNLDDLKKQSQFAAAHLTAKPNLKKQSQFVPGLNGANSFMEGDYDNIPVHETGENKANQSQFIPGMPAEGPRISEKSITAGTG